MVLATPYRIDNGGVISTTVSLAKLFSSFSVFTKKMYMSGNCSNLVRHKECFVENMDTFRSGLS